VFENKKFKNLPGIFIQVMVERSSIVAHGPFDHALKLNKGQRLRMMLCEFLLNTANSAGRSSSIKRSKSRRARSHATSKSCQAATKSMSGSAGIGMSGFIGVPTVQRPLIPAARFGLSVG